MITVKLRHVWHRYPGMIGWALKDISTEFGSRRIILVSGRNGSGKTTLLKIAALLYKPWRGEVTVDGQSFWEMDEAEKIMSRRRIAYVHEKPILLRGSVLENVAYPLRLRGLKWGNAASKAEEIMRELELVELADKDVKELSAGQSQLAAVARALVADPELIFLDGPFAHLDSRKSELVGQVLRARERNGAGIVIASHGRGELPKGLEPDKIIALEEGQVKL